jgi:hypothetical protein
MSATAQEGRMTDPQRTITQVMEKLLAYVQHKRTCPKSMMVTFAAEPGWVTGSYVKPCTCGLDDLAAVLSGSREQKEQETTRVDDTQYGERSGTAASHGAMRSLYRSGDYHDIDEGVRIIRIYRNGSYLAEGPRGAGRKRYGFMPHEPLELQMTAENLMSMACDTTNKLTVFDRKTLGDAAAQISLMADRLVAKDREAGCADAVPTCADGENQISHDPTRSDPQTEEPPR